MFREHLPQHLLDEDCEEKPPEGEKSEDEFDYSVSNAQLEGILADMATESKAALDKEQPVEESALSQEMQDKFKDLDDSLFDNLLSEVAAVPASAVEHREPEVPASAETTQPVSQQHESQTSRKPRVTAKFQFKY